MVEFSMILLVIASFVFLCVFEFFIREKNPRTQNYLLVACIVVGLIGLTALGMFIHYTSL